MSYYYQNFITVPGFKNYLLSDQGHMYHKSSGILMEPLIHESVKIYKNEYDKYLMITMKNGELWYATTQGRTESMAVPKKLSLNTRKMLKAEITLKWIDHICYFPNSKEGIKQAIEWSEYLEKQYYPVKL